MTIDFINEREWGIDPSIFRQAIGRLKKVIRPYQGLFNVVFVNDVYIRALNKKYRHKDKPTDVLSFYYGDEGLAGEIYISVETARRQAEQLGHSLPNELNKLFVHGFLHIHGYDHENDTDYEVMHNLECRVLEADMT